jgi:hypothetical protein
VKFWTWIQSFGVSNFFSICTYINVFVSKINHSMMELAIRIAVSFYFMPGA